MFFVIWVAYTDACNRINAQWGPVVTQSIFSKVLTIYAPSFTHGGELCGVYCQCIFYIKASQNHIRPIQRTRVARNFCDVLFYSCHRCLIRHTVKPLIQDAAYFAIKLLITQM